MKLLLLGLTPRFYAKGVYTISAGKPTRASLVINDIALKISPIPLGPALHGDEVAIEFSYNEKTDSVYNIDIVEFLKAKTIYRIGQLFNTPRGVVVRCKDYRFPPLLVSSNIAEISGLPDLPLTEEYLGGYPKSIFLTTKMKYYSADQIRTVKSSSENIKFNDLNTLKTELKVEKTTDNEIHSETTEVSHNPIEDLDRLSIKNKKQRQFQNLNSPSTLSKETNEDKKNIDNIYKNKYNKILLKKHASDISTTNSILQDDNKKITSISNEKKFVKNKIDHIVEGLKTNKSNEVISSDKNIDQKNNYSSPNISTEGYKISLLSKRPAQILSKSKKSYISSLESSELVWYRVVRNGTQFATAEILSNFGNSKSVNAQCFEILQNNLLLHSHGWIPKGTVKAKESPRTDLTNENIFTIDPSTAKDLDDAISVNIITDNKTSYIEIGVHIADVTAFLPREYITTENILENKSFDWEKYLKSGHLEASTSMEQDTDKIDLYTTSSNLTNEEQARLIRLSAQYKTTTVYLKQGNLPMLPRVLSEDLCSLHENQIRKALSLFITVDTKGRVVSKFPVRIAETKIKVSRRFSYAEANHLLESLENGDQIKAEDIAYAAKLDILSIIASWRRLRGLQQGRMELENDDIHYENNSSGTCTDIYIKPKGYAEQLIAESMILANRATAEFLRIVSRKPRASSLLSPNIGIRTSEYISKADFEIPSGTVSSLGSSLTRAVCNATSKSDKEKTSYQLVGKENLDKTFKLSNKFRDQVKVENQNRNMKNSQYKNKTLDELRNDVESDLGYKLNNISKGNNEHRISSMIEILKDMGYLGPLKVNRNWIIRKGLNMVFPLRQHNNLDARKHSDVIRRMNEVYGEGYTAESINRGIRNFIHRAHYVSSSTVFGLYHHGLALPYYTHFTSPIRRYMDILVHDCIKASHKSTELTKDNTSFYQSLDRIKPDIKETRLGSKMPKSIMNSIDTELNKEFKGKKNVIRFKSSSAINLKLAKPTISGKKINQTITTKISNITETNDNLNNINIQAKKHLKHEFKIYSNKNRVNLYSKNLYIYRKTDIKPLNRTTLWEVIKWIKPVNVPFSSRFSRNILYKSVVREIKKQYNNTKLLDQSRSLLNQKISKLKSFSNEKISKSDINIEENIASRIPEVNYIRNSIEISAQTFIYKKTFHIKTNLQTREILFIARISELVSNKLRGRKTQPISTKGLSSQCANVHMRSQSHQNASLNSAVISLSTYLKERPEGIIADGIVQSIQRSSSGPTIVLHFPSLGFQYKGLIEDLGVDIVRGSEDLVTVYDYNKIDQENLSHIYKRFGDTEIHSCPSPIRTSTQISSLERVINDYEKCNLSNDDDINFFANSIKTEFATTNKFIDTEDIKRLPIYDEVNANSFETTTKNDYPNNIYENTNNMDDNLKKNSKKSKQESELKATNTNSINNIKIVEVKQINSIDIKNNSKIKKPIITENNFDSPNNTYKLNKISFKLNKSIGKSSKFKVQKIPLKLSENELSNDIVSKSNQSIVTLNKCKKDLRKPIDNIVEKKIQFNKKIAHTSMKNKMRCLTSKKINTHSTGITQQSGKTTIIKTEGNTKTMNPFNKSNKYNINFNIYGEKKLYHTFRYFNILLPSNKINNLNLYSYNFKCFNKNNSFTNYEFKDLAKTYLIKLSLHYLERLENQELKFYKINDYKDRRTVKKFQIKELYRKYEHQNLQSLETLDIILPKLTDVKKILKRTLYTSNINSYLKSSSNINYSELIYFNPIYSYSNNILKTSIRSFGVDQKLQKIKDNLDKHKNTEIYKKSSLTRQSSSSEVLVNNITPNNHLIGEKIKSINFLPKFRLGNSDKSVEYNSKWKTSLESPLIMKPTCQESSSGLKKPGIFQKKPLINKLGVFSSEILYGGKHYLPDIISATSKVLIDSSDNIEQNTTDVTELKLREKIIRHRVREQSLSPLRSFQEYLQSGGPGLVIVSCKLRSRKTQHNFLVKLFQPLSVSIRLVNDELKIEILPELVKETLYSE